MTTSKEIYIYGEVLFDLFEDGRAVLGGAPFNVAWHLRGFGHQPLFISRVGEDDYGRQILEAMRLWGMSTDFIQQDPQRPTGRVEVKLFEGQPQFSILSDQAYDAISIAPILLHLSSRAASPLLYHGSLALRTPEAKANFEQLKAHLNPRIFLDVNLRAPWWTELEVSAMIRGVEWLKLNDEEAFAICYDEESSPEEAARKLLHWDEIQAVILTKGEKGAYVATPRGSFTGAPDIVGLVVDTVGAGDAFSAVFIHGLTEGWAMQTILARALQFAGEICMIRGATTDDRKFYNRILKSWKRES